MENDAATQYTCKLSLHKLHRTSQKAVIDDAEIAVSHRSLHSEL